MKALVLRAAAVALVTLAIPNAADAGWVPGFSGSAFIVDVNNPTIPNADGVVNFAVYRADSTTWYTDLGLSASVVKLWENPDGNTPASTVAVGTYIYMYQVVNTVAPGGPGSEDRALDRLLLRNTGNTPLATGYLDQTVFTDGAGAVGPGIGGSASGNTGNYRLGVDTSTPGTVTTSAPGFATGVTGALNAEFFDWNDGLRTNQPAGTAFSFNLPGGSGVSGAGLQPNRYTSVMFIFSNQAPVYGLGQLSDTLYGNGSVPVPSPEPGTLVLLGLGVPALGFGYLRRLRASKALAAASV